MGCAVKPRQFACNCDPLSSDRMRLTYTDAHSGRRMMGGPRIA